MRILLIGPLPPPQGGTTVAFDTLSRQLLGTRSDADRIKVINSNVSGKALLLLPLCIAQAVLRSDVITLHVGNRGAVILTPWVYLFARLFGRPLICRKFGGVFDRYYAKLPVYQRYLLDKTFFRSDLILFETRKLQQAFAAKNANTRWFPNTRDMPKTPLQSPSADAELKLMYLGHIRKSKGILEIIEAAKYLPQVKVDVYGPFYDGLDASVFDCTGVHYAGELESESVMTVMSEYHALLFPSYYPGEGYPGVVIEAKMAGLAVICSDWISLPELVTHEKDGLITPARDVNALKNAILRLDTDRQLLTRLRDNSRDSADMYALSDWSEVFYQHCRALYQR